MENTSLLSKLEYGSKRQEDWYRFHPRVWSHKGVIVDLGCLGWDLSKCFLGKKRVIGADPDEKKIPVGAQLFNGFVGNYNGTMRFYKSPIAGRTTAFYRGDGKKPIISWRHFCRKFEIDSVSLLKMNIEGMEYDLLIHELDPMPDQIVVSFHDTSHIHENPVKITKALEAILFYLSDKYDYCMTFRTNLWYVFVRR